MSEPVRTRLPADVYVLVAGAFVVAAGYGLVAPVLPRFAHSFGVSNTAASAVVSVFAFMRFVSAPLAGRLADRVGQRSTYLSGLVVVALSTLAAGFAGSYLQLLGLRGAGGLGSAMFTVSALGLLASLAPPAARGRVTGLYASAFLVGNIVGPVLGGTLGHFGMRIPFFVYAVALLVAAAVVAVFLAGGRRTPGVTAPARDPMPLREALADPAYRAALTSNFANGWASMGVRVATVPLFAASIAGEGSAFPGVALTGFAVGTAAVVGIAGTWSDRIGRRPLVVGGLLVAGAATIALGLSRSVPVVVVTSIVAGAGTGLLNSSQQASVVDLVGAERGPGRVMSTYQMASDAGAILGPLVVGVVVDRFGFPAGFALTGALLVAAAVAWVTARETLPSAVGP